MLNLTAAMATVFREYLTRERPPLPGDLVFAAVADEEAGGSYGAGHLVEQHWDLVGCDYLLTEVATPGFRTPLGLTLPVTVAPRTSDASTPAVARSSATSTGSAAPWVSTLSCHWAR